MAIKWKNVKEKYRKYEAGKATRPRLQRPDYFDIIATFLEGRPQDHVMECGLEDILTPSQDTPQSQVQDKDFAKMLQQTIEEINKGKKRASYRGQHKEQTTTESHGQDEEDEDEDGNASAPKRTYRMRVDRQVGRTLKMILEENQRHNTAVELHNAQMRLLFAKMVNSMEVKNKILKDVVEKENSMEV